MPAPVLQGIGALELLKKHFDAGLGDHCPDDHSHIAEKLVQFKQEAAAPAFVVKHSFLILTPNACVRHKELALCLSGWFFLCIVSLQVEENNKRLLSSLYTEEDIISRKAELDKLLAATTTWTLSYSRPSVSSSVPAGGPPAKPSNAEAPQKTYLEAAAGAITDAADAFVSFFSANQEEAEKALRQEEEESRLRLEATRRRQEKAREEARRSEEARLRHDARRQYEQTQSSVNEVIQQNANEGLQAVRGGNFEVAGSVSFFIGLIKRHLWKHLTPKTNGDIRHFESELGNRLKTTVDGLMRSLSDGGNAREAIEELGDLTVLGGELGAFESDSI